jgi:DNA primase
MNLFSFIKQHIALLDVVSEYATLKKAGMYFKGTCPFHYERTASFTVSPHKEIFYCFGCHAGGDVISFIAKVEHCSQLEAAKQLIERYNLTVPQEIVLEKSSHTQEERTTYYKTTVLFSQWCEQHLAQKPEIISYLTKRGIDQRSIREFNLGYCPQDIQGLLAAGQKQNILAHNFIDAHILMQGKHGLYIPFEDRIIFPIKDHLGRCVGFGGRIYKVGDERVKYSNSHDHTFFNKSTLLYGLDRAKKAIAQKEAAFLVEGYTDLIIMNQHGFTNTIATLGTACTPDHLKGLSRYAQRLYLLYDGDAAGQNAILRVAELCWQVAIDPYVIQLPKDHDPASFLIEGGDLQKLIDEAHDIFSFVLNTLAGDFASKSLQDRLGITKKIMTMIGQLSDPLKRELLLKQASDVFSLPQEALKEELRRTRPVLQKQEEVAKESSPDLSPLEKKLFSAILFHKSTVQEEDTSLLRLFLHDTLRDLFDRILEHKTAQGIDMTGLFELLSPTEKEWVSRLMMEVEATGKESSDYSLDELLTQFYKKQWKITVHNVKLRIDEAQQEGNIVQVKLLLNNLDTLKKKMLGRNIT